MKEIRTALNLLAALAFIPIAQAIATEALLEYFGLKRAIVILIVGGVGSALAIVMGVVVYRGVMWAFKGLRHRVSMEFGEQPADKSAAVVMSFSRPEHADKLLEYHRPKRMVLIATTKGRAASKPLADEWCKQKSSQGTTIQVPDIENAYDAAEMNAEANRQIEKLIAEGLRPDQISADITGGTVPMSVGLLAAALSHNVPVTYMPPKKTDREGRGVELDDPKRVEISVYQVEDEQQASTPTAVEGSEKEKAGPAGGEPSGPSLRCLRPHGDGRSGC